MAGRAPATGLRWLRATLTYGEFAHAAGAHRARLNMVPALAVQTIRNDALEPVQGGPPDGRTRLQLSRTPVLPGTLTLQVDDDAGTDIFGTAAEESSTWFEVPSLAGRSADDPVFTVDPDTGIVTFGDGVQGRKVPVGFRNVTAVSYQVGGGRGRTGRGRGDHRDGDVAAVRDRSHEPGPGGGRLGPRAGTERRPARRASSCAPAAGPWPPRTTGCSRWRPLAR